MIVRDFEGRDWPDVNPEKIDVDEWRELKRKYRMTPKQFEEAMGEADPDASTFFYWLMLRRAGDHLAVLGDGLKFDLLELNKALSAAQEEDAAAEAELKKAEREAELEEAAAAAALRAAAGPTSPPGPLSPEPASRPDTTLTHPGPTPDPAATSTSGSGAATSNGSARSTSSGSRGSATSARSKSGG